MQGGGANPGLAVLAGLNHLSDGAGSRGDVVEPLCALRPLLARFHGRLTAKMPCRRGKSGKKRKKYQTDCLPSQILCLPKLIIRTHTSVLM